MKRIFSVLFFVVALGVGTFSVSAKTSVSQWLSNVKAFVEDIEDQDDFSGDLKDDYDRAMHDYEVNFKKTYRGSMTKEQRQEYTNLKSRYTKHVNEAIANAKKQPVAGQECGENVEANKPRQENPSQQPQGHQPAPRK